MSLRSVANPLLATVIPAVILSFVVQSGCGVDRDTIESLQSAVGAVAAANQQASGQTVELPPQAITEVQFTAPHPQRVDPFSFPENAELNTQRKSSLDTVAEVEVLGFADVGQLHVLLRSQNKSESLKVGESIGPVRVVEIHPPSVKLQMGTLIWTATMFDKPSNQ